MPDNEEFWNFYWEVRLQPMENLGKRAAILAASRLIRSLSQQVNHPLRLLELGCGEGQVIGQLLDAHAQSCSLPASVGVDYNPQSLARLHRDYPALEYVEGDFTDPELLDRLGKFELVILVNALHEVFSDTYSPELGEIDIPAAKLQVKKALVGAVSCLESGGWLVLFDGLEPTGDPNQTVRIHFQDHQVRQEFEIFVRQYHPFRVTYQEIDGPMTIELSRRDFTRYVTKTIFLGKQLWETERLQSYQYFTEEEFRKVLASEGLLISELIAMTMNEEKWNRMVDIETPGFRFPEEHILILAQLTGHSSQQAHG